MATSLGGAWEFAAATDIRVSTIHATFGLPENKIGIVPGWSGTQRLQRLLPEPVIKEMALLGRRIDAQRGFDLGFIAELTEDPLKTAYEIAAHVCEFAPVATEISKMQIHAGC